MLNDKELYRELGALTKRKEDWQGSIAYVGSLLENHSQKITAKALWLLGGWGCYIPKRQHLTSRR